MKFPLVLSIFFLFLILSSLHSQEGWRQITTNVGLSSDTIHSLIQSENGDIWIGTDKGIDRYNGIVLSSLYTSSQVDAFSLTGSDIVFARATHLITVSENDLISEEKYRLLLDRQ